MSTRGRVLETLRSHTAPTTVADLAAQLGIHPNTVRFHLDQLMALGAAERVPSTPQGPGRPALRIRATTPPMPSTRHFRLLAEALSLALAAAPDATDLAEQAGRTLGRRLTADSPAPDTEAVTALLGTLHDLDFAPVRSGPEQIDLHSCPFLELVDTGDRVACAVHLGLMRGALDQLDASTEVVSLTPFVSPTHCVTRLRTAG